MSPSSILLTILLQIPAASPAPVPAPPAPAPAVRVDVRVEHRRESFSYHLENPSNIDDTGLVPHHIDQHYDAHNDWLVGAATYRLFGGAAWTEVGLTPRRTRAGSDIDTFFLASGDVATSGSRGLVRLRGLSLQQRIEMSEWRGWTLGLTFGYRRFSMDFLPTDRIVTHSLPPSDVREAVQTLETTWSHVLETGFSAWRTMDVAKGWRLSIAGDATPLLRTRLGIRLPTKYPGQIIRSDSFGLAARGRIAIERGSDRRAIGLGLTLNGARGYRRTARHVEHGAGVDVGVTIGR